MCMHQVFICRFAATNGDINTMSWFVLVANSHLPASMQEEQQVKKLKILQADGVTRG